MKSKSKLLFASGMLAVAFISASLESPAHAQSRTGQWKIKDGYQGPLCVYGRARGNISLKWGNWSKNINGNEIRRKGAFNYQSDHTQQLPPLPPYVSMPLRAINIGVSALAKADQFVSHMQGYNIEIPAGDSSQLFFISDRTARVRSQSCGFGDPFTVRL
jgi:hypothetical protein